MPAPAKHETRALLRAHLSAASGFGHLTRRCPVCLRLQRLAMEPSQGPAGAGDDQEAGCFLRGLQQDGTPRERPEAAEGGTQEG
jgi:Family of unknown function (DUF6274)